MLSDLFWMGRYAERAESMARLLTVTRERYHEFRYRQDMPGSECVPVLLTALGTITGTDTGAGGDYAEMIATAPTTLWSLTADRHRPGSLAQSVERLGLAARAVRDQMSNDTWMVLAAVERAVLQRAPTPRRNRRPRARRILVVGAPLTLAGMLALSGVAAESMVQDVGWTMMDIGKRIERGLALTALLRATLTTVALPGAEQTITESTLVACESSVIYRRRNLGAVSVPRVAELVLFDAENPRSLVYQFERLRTDLKALPRVVGIVAAGAAGRRDRHPAAQARPGRPRGRHADGSAARTRRPARRHASRSARAVGRHHRDPPVAAGRACSRCGAPTNGG